MGAALAALAIAVVEASVIGAKTGAWRAALAAPAAGCALAAVGAAGAIMIVLLVKSALSQLERSGAAWTGLLGALVGSSLAVLGAQALVLKVLSGQGIRTAAVALSAMLGVVVGTTLALALHALLARLPWRMGLRGRTGVVVACAALTVIAVVALAPGFIEELDVSGLVLASCPLVLGVVLATIGSDRAWALRATLGAAGLLITLTIAHVTMAAPRKLPLYVARNSTAARFVFGVLPSSGRNKLAPIEPTGTCHPGKKPGRLRGATKAAADAPDILFITVDAVRWDHLTMAGYKRDTTPSLARWSKKAAVFSAAYSPASSTRQSFRALFSGLFPSQVPVSEGSTWWGLTFAPKQVTLASYLEKAGYRTFAGADRAEGFDSKKGGALKGFNRFLKPKKLDGEKLARTARARHQIDSVLEEFRAPRDQPLFAWSHVVVPHQPYTVDTASPYGTSEIDRYDWAIHFVDEQIARLLDALEAEGRLARTYVILSADHGQAFGEHANQLHGRTVYQEETNVPLLIWGPSVVPGLREEPVATLDVFPTVLDVAGLGEAEEVCGETLVPWLEDPKVGAGRDIYIEKIPDARKEFAIAYIKGWHKLVVAPRTCTLEVFDLRKDKGDRNDLSERDPALTDQLVRSLAAFQRAAGLNPKSYCLP